LVGLVSRSFFPSPMFSLPAYWIVGRHNSGFVSGKKLVGSSLYSLSSPFLLLGYSVLSWCVVFCVLYFLKEIFLSFGLSLLVFFTFIPFIIVIAYSSKDAISLFKFEILQDEPLRLFP
jgi:hypothetical protein